MWTDLRGWEAEGSQRNLRKGSLSMVTCLRWLVPWAKGLILKLDPSFPPLRTIFKIWKTQRKYIKNAYI